VASSESPCSASWSPTPTQRGRCVDIASITLTGIGKVYPNGFQAVSELEPSIDDGQLMVLVGPSGCGKTTVLWQVRARVQEAARLLGLAELLEQKPGQLSGGRGQRVATGRAIVREPAAFLMDEPLSNLDVKLRVELRAEVSRIQRRLGVARIYVTHDQTEAMTMGDRVAALRDGLLQQSDKPLTEAGELTRADTSIARLEPRTNIRPGERIRLRVPPERLHFFDTGTGEAL
jgi:ABC-type sugar transport system ATPase subunit